MRFASIGSPVAWLSNACRRGLASRRCGGRRRKRAERGFTLIEALAAIVILALSLTALLSAHDTGVRGAAAIDDHLQARLLAQSLLARGRLGTALGWSGATRDTTRARQALIRMVAPEVAGEVAEAASAPAPATLSLASRFASVLEAGRRIASALSREAVFAAVQEVRSIAEARMLLRRAGPCPCPPR